MAADKSSRPIRIQSIKYGAVYIKPGIDKLRIGERPEETGFAFQVIPPILSTAPCLEVLINQRVIQKTPAWLISCA